jgi:tRNA (guanosine-2'-O-)-methyltransferase
VLHDDIPDDRHTDTASDDRALRDALAHHPLLPEVTERRLTRIVDVVRSRLSSVTIVMENLADSHNVSAVLRTSEGFGLDTIHVVEQPNPFERNKAITKGSDRWIEVARHKGLARCLGDLSARGFTLFAADVGEGCVPLEEIPVDKPVALIMGSEHAGLSKRALSLCDARFTIPMHGFVESFNVSVSAAISLYDVTHRRRRHLQRRGDLDFAAQVARADGYLKRSVKDPRVIARREADAARGADDVDTSDGAQD